MTLKIKRIVDSGHAWQESDERILLTEPLHLSLASADWLMRDFGPMFSTQALPVTRGQIKIREHRCIRS